VLETDIEREKLLEEQEELEKSGLPSATLRLNQVYKRLDEIEASEAESKAAIILGGVRLHSRHVLQTSRLIIWRLENEGRLS